MTDPTPNPTPAREAVAIARNDLALRIAMDVLGDMGRADGLAEWLGRDGTDLGQAVARLITAARADERAQWAEMAELWRNKYNEIRGTMAEVADENVTLRAEVARLRKEKWRGEG